MKHKNAIQSITVLFLVLFFSSCKQEEKNNTTITFSTVPEITSTDDFNKLKKDKKDKIELRFNGVTRKGLFKPSDKSYLSNNFMGTWKIKDDSVNLDGKLAFLVFKDVNIESVLSFHYLLKQEDLISPTPYQLTDNKNLKLLAIEDLSKIVVESSKYREGNLYYLQGKDNNIQLKALDEKGLSKKPELEKQNQLAQIKFEEIIQNKAFIGDGFNLKKFAKYTAYCKKFGLADLKCLLYFNPLNAQFEPIALHPSLLEENYPTLELIFKDQFQWLENYSHTIEIPNKIACMVTGHHGFEVNFINTPSTEKNKSSVLIVLRENYLQVLNLTGQEINAIGLLYNKTEYTLNHSFEPGVMASFAYPEKIEKELMSLGKNKEPLTLLDQYQNASIVPGFYFNPKNFNHQTFGNELTWNETATLLQKNMLIPEGFSVIVPENIPELNLNNHSIFSFSPFLKTDSYTTKIISKGEGGLYFCEMEKADMNNYHFYNLGYAKSENWETTGALSFYDTKLYLHKIEMHTINAEDAINAVRVVVAIDGVKISDNYSDAIDIDFGTGTLKNIEINRSGNDGIDISGADLTMTQIHLNHIGDKGISVGEHSKAQIDSVFIDKAVMGIVAKDLSVAKVKWHQISNTTTPDTTYQKKDEFGDGVIEFVN